MIWRIFITILAIFYFFIFEIWYSQKKPNSYNKAAQPVFTCSKLKTETIEQGVKYIQSYISHLDQDTLSKHKYRLTDWTRRIRSQNINVNKDKTVFSDVYYVLSITDLLQCVTWGSFLKPMFLICFQQLRKESSPSTGLPWFVMFVRVTITLLCIEPMYLLFTSPLQPTSAECCWETSHLICSANQMTGFSMKCSTELKWVKRWLYFIKFKNGG